MATKRTKQSPTKQKPADQARALWLAGLGAVSIAQKRGGELLSELITEGHDLQSRAQKLAQQVTSQAAEQAKDALTPFQVEFKRNIKKLGTAVQNGVAGALAVLGIPSKSDIEELTQRVAALSKQLKTAR
jgi:poly(hydroxyalkanoate) granule-associated protein